MQCHQCGAENRPSSRFCRECGAALTRSCASCGSALEAGARFCDQCGTAVEGAPAAPADVAVRAAPTAERRLVSILFVDLVGFTTLSEQRDAEDVRDLLTRYFDGCRSVITRYGGVVEKFIGDAVMAVWGSPAAHEDDAERAVRAALDIVEVVASLGAELSMPTLRARAGVLTGEAAVTIGAATQGMVAGDMVNTASRIQAAAEPGTVLVGDATHRATEAAIAYEDAGERALKGKAEPVRLWRAVRVVGTRRGALRSGGFEAPFSGRDSQLRLVKDLFHAAADGRAAHLVSVVGVAGVGKSRLAWEFCKYIDGLVDDVNWHQGRCLAYGDGVTYSALAEIVRMRTGIAEGEQPGTALEKLRTCLGEYVPDADEQRWIEPRLAHLLGLEDRSSSDRDDLFGAWRLFFERLAEDAPTVLIIEDLQWADPSLIAFIEHLLDWSQKHALYVVTLARPELAERHPSWGSGKRSFTSLVLDPLPDTVMHQLLLGLVPEMPDDLGAQIVDRAAGIPLYAVETVRSLVDRGLLAADGETFHLVGEVDTLAVPETLHALIAARLDALPAESRQLLQDAAVLGKNFTSAAVAAVTGRTEAEVAPILDDLVRREVLTIQTDPRSPERGQLGFVQDLIRWVAYETLSRRDRKQRHLAAAAWITEAWGDTDADSVEVVAAHLLEAHRLGSGDVDADEVRDSAAAAVLRAADHAAALAANAEAQRYYERALPLVDGAAEEAEVHERVAEMALLGGRLDTSTEHFRRAIELFEACGLAHRAARAEARAADIDRSRGNLDRAIERMEAAFAVLTGDVPDADLAELAAQLGRFHFFAGNLDAAMSRTRSALDLAERIPLPAVIANALNTLGVIAITRGNREEARALVAHALQVALLNDVSSVALRSYCNLADGLARRDDDAAAINELRLALTVARRVGDRFNERYALSELTGCLYRIGEWDTVVDTMSGIPRADLVSGELLSMFESALHMAIHRGNLPEARALVEEGAPMASSSDLQTVVSYAAAVVALDRAEGTLDAAFDGAVTLLKRERPTMSLDDEPLKKAFADGIEAGILAGRLDEVRRLLDGLDAESTMARTRFIEAHSARFRARLAMAAGHDQGVDVGFARAITTFEEIESPFWLAATRLEEAEWLSTIGRRREAEALVEAARSTFARLGATPWIARCESVEVLSSAS